MFIRLSAIHQDILTAKRDYFAVAGHRALASRSCVASLYVWRNSVCHSLWRTAKLQFCGGMLRTLAATTTKRRGSGDNYLPCLHGTDDRSNIYNQRFLEDWLPKWKTCTCLCLQLL